MYIRKEFCAEKYILYARKSSDENRRKQLRSISSQIREMIEIAAKYEIEIEKVIQESKSAKETGRPVFNELLDEVITRNSKGEKIGIMIWDASRLARNTQDGGLVVHLLQKGAVQHIISYERDYTPNDNVQSLMDEFCDSTEYVRKLGRAVKRGYRTKAAEGWYPYVKMIVGYKATPYDEYNPDRDRVIPDERTYSLALSILRLALTKRYSMMQLWRESARIGLCNEKGKPYSYNAISKMVKSPMFAGYFWDKDESGGNVLRKGKHAHEMSLEQHYEILKFFTTKYIPRPTTKLDFAYRCTLSCGSCGRTFCPERKAKTICRGCGHKYSVVRNTVCGKCGHDVSAIKNPKIYAGVYYRCRSRKTSCRELYIREDHIDRQVRHLLGEINLEGWYVQKAIEACEWLRKTKNRSDGKLHSNSEEQIKNLEDEMFNVVRMRNNGELSSDEFRKYHERLKMELAEISQSKKQGLQEVDWVKVYKRRLQLARDAIERFDTSKQHRAEFLRNICPRPEISNRNIVNKGFYPFFEEKRMMVQLDKVGATSAPSSTIEKQGCFGVSEPPFSDLLAHIKRVRAQILKDHRLNSN